MDFDRLDLREAADNQYWVHLRMGETLLFADMDKQERPCRVKVASVASPDVEASMKAVTRAGSQYSAVEGQMALANRNQTKELENKLNGLEREAEKALTHFLVTSVKGWENIEKGGKPLEYSLDALKNMAAPKAPLYRLATTLAQDAAGAQSPFVEAESA